MPKEKRNLSLSEANQRHADEYFDRLMTVADQDLLLMDTPQIALAIRRLQSEEVGSVKYLPGELVSKYLVLAGGYVNWYLGELLIGHLTAQDYDRVKAAIDIVERGEVSYPANLGFLKQKQLELLSL